jgi:hypothetical protein
VLDAAPAEAPLAELLKPAAASPVAAAVAAPSGNATRVLVVRNTHHDRLSGWKHNYDYKWTLADRFPITEYDARFAIAAASRPQVGIREEGLDFQCAA